MLRASIADTIDQGAIRIDPTARMTVGAQIVRRTGPIGKPTVLTERQTDLIALRAARIEKRTVPTAQEINRTERQTDPIAKKVLRAWRDQASNPRQTGKRDSATVPSQAEKPKTAATFNDPPVRAAMPAQAHVKLQTPLGGDNHESTYSNLHHCMRSHVDLRRLFSERR